MTRIGEDISKGLDVAGTSLSGIATSPANGPATAAAELRPYLGGEFVVFAGATQMTEM
ncbi:hypothetical protein [Aquabacterium parvum]|uniref:hypothetical protein n=1 Tax=Aquabacterium parvum TaxID=70584 RepID=UPI0013651A4C|nr:hypothetical protein [Aquabacterium parvum]MBU0914791.1 hypothetical protein [Gammaproteobacteria bacterium]